MERTMVLQEITQMTKQLDCLRNQPERVQQGEDLVRQQHRIQTTKLKFKATKAEVSIYKVLSLVRNLLSMFKTGTGFRL